MTTGASSRTVRILVVASGEAARVVVATPQVLGDVCTLVARALPDVDASHDEMMADIAAFGRDIAWRWSYWPAPDDTRDAVRARLAVAGRLARVRQLATAHVAQAASLRRRRCVRAA